MNTNTHGRRTSMSVRRAVPAIAIVALAIGLGACQTPPGGAAVPQAPVIQPAEVPAREGLTTPSDRVTQAIERAEALKRVQSDRFNGMTADRIEAQLEYEASLTVKSTDRFQGMTADRIEDAIARERAASGEGLNSASAARLTEQYDRAAHGLQVK